MKKLPAIKVHFNKEGYYGRDELMAVNQQLRQGYFIEKIVLVPGSEKTGSMLILLEKPEKKIAKRIT